MSSYKQKRSKEAVSLGIWQIKWSIQLLIQEMYKDWYLTADKRSGHIQKDKKDNEIEK